MLPKDQLKLLHQFVGIIKGNPKILLAPELKFFKDWLESLGAKIPESSPGTNAQQNEQKEKVDDKDDESDDDDEEMPDLEDIPSGAQKEDTAPETKEESEEEDLVESDLELEELEGIVKDETAEELEMGDDNLEVTEEMMEESSAKRSEALSAMSEGNFDEAIRLFTEAIKKNPQSANLYAKRACVLTKAKKPSAAIADCEKALEINKDSAQPYKWRGRAYRLQGKYEEAYHDFQMACRLDFDETSLEWQKEVEANAKKIMEHRRKYERLREEKERNAKIKEAKRRKAEAQKEYERTRKEEEARNKAGGMPGGFPGGMPGGFPGGMSGGFPGGMPGGFPGGMPGGAGGGGMPGGAAGGGMPDLSALFSDPELMTAMQDPDVMNAFKDVSQNPQNMHKYENNPKVKRVIEKLQKKFGAAGATPH